MKINHLVERLNEVYQPIYNHPEYDSYASRSCDDRLKTFFKITEDVSLYLGRTLNILDLGCAQGFFSFCLASRGHCVHGIDFQEMNIDVCDSLANENPDLNVSFSVCRVQDFIDQLCCGEYDIVLGLSLFHHIIHDSGLTFAQELVKKIAGSCTILLAETALSSEPPNWSASQPNDPKQLVADIAFVGLVETFKTHLSDISRPLFFCSNSLSYLGGTLRPFFEWSPTTVARSSSTHHNTRRFYCGTYFIKCYQLTNAPAEVISANLREFKNEILFLKALGGGDILNLPKLIDHGNSNGEAWIVRELIEGCNLESAITSGQPAFDAEDVLRDILDMLVKLEDQSLYHSDIRTWNIVLTTKGKAVLVDYGAISNDNSDCCPPYNSFYSFAVLVITLFNKSCSEFSPINQAFDTSRVPIVFRKAIGEMFITSSASKPFAAFQRVLKSGLACAGSSRQSPQVIDMIIESLRAGAPVCQKSQDNATIESRQLSSPGGSVGDK